MPTAFDASVRRACPARHFRRHSAAACALYDADVVASAVSRCQKMARFRRLQQMPRRRLFSRAAAASAATPEKRLPCLILPAPMRRWPPCQSARAVAYALPKMPGAARAALPALLDRYSAHKPAALPFTAALPFAAAASARLRALPGVPAMTQVEARHATAAMAQICRGFTHTALL